MAPQFRLATLLKLREQARDERRRELAQAFAAERVLRGRVAELQAEIESTRQRTRQASGQGSVNVEGLLTARRYESIVKAQVSTVNAQIGQVLEEIERRRLTLLEADRDVKVLEKLRVRQAEQFAELAQQRESKQIDEAALRGFVRRREVTP